jgi:hypothetical protein
MNEGKKEGRRKKEKLRCIIKGAFQISRGKMDYSIL